MKRIIGTDVTSEGQWNNKTDFIYKGKSYECIYFFAQTDSYDELIALINNCIKGQKYAILKDVHVVNPRKGNDELCEPCLMAYIAPILDERSN